MKFFLKSVLFFLIWSLGFFSQSFSQSHVNPRAEWFVNSRFGMFVHWGVYSGAEGVWRGEKLRYDNDYAEWIFYRNRINKEDYLTLLDRFDWSAINPEDWVILAKKAGMKYITLTAKHHDGFALWDSQVGNYDIGEVTEPRRDIVKELASACHKHGLKLGLYYSHWVDWEHPYGWDHTKEIYPITSEQYNLYWQEKVIPQMRELLTNYGDIGLIWFDMWLHHSHTIVTKEQLKQLKNLIRELQPDCLINSRLGLSIEEDPDVDFRTLGDNSFGTMKLDYPWQSPATVAHSWGFNALEEQWKSSTTLLGYLISNVSLNGNMMLNIGPRANGKVPYEIQTRLLEIGEWLDRNGESIYGASGFDLETVQHDWCKITTKVVDDKTRLYCHIRNWPLTSQVKITGITSPPDQVYLLQDQNTKLPVEFHEVVTRIKLPDSQPDPLYSVLVLEYSSRPSVRNGLVAESQSRGYACTPNNWDRVTGTPVFEPAARFGSVPEHIVVSESSHFDWQIYLDESGNYRAFVSYANSSDWGVGTMEMNLNGQSRKMSCEPTGLTVGEPGGNWHIPAFESVKTLEVSIDQPGYYTLGVTLNPQSSSELLFQWVWLERY